MGVLFLLACQDPLGDRHDLDGFRIAAVSATSEAEGLRAEAAIVVGGRLTTDDPVDVRWTLNGARSTQPRPLLDAPTSESVLELRVTRGDAVREAILVVPAGGHSMPALVDIDVDGNQPVVLSAVFADAVDPVPRVRWMSTAPHGRFEERTRTSTDWFAPADDGFTNVLALATDGDGGTSWVVRDLWVGEPVGLQVEGRWVAGDPELAGTGWRVVDLHLDETAPTGVGVTVVGAPLDVPASFPQVCGLEAPFDPRWLVTGQCTLAELDGARTVLDLR